MKFKDRLKIALGIKRLDVKKPTKKRPSRPTSTNKSTKNDQKTISRLDSIDNNVQNLITKLDKHDRDIKQGQTNLIGLVTDGFRERLKSIAQSTKEPTKSFRSVFQNVLTDREKQIISLLLDEGHLTYREIAKYFNLNPTTIKNTINNMMKDMKKNELLVKTGKNPARVGISDGLKEEILRGKIKQENRV